jgi:hypothetical protein
VLRLLAVLLVVFGLLLTPRVQAQEADEFDIPTVAISGGDLPFTVTLAPADADSFRRRVNQLPRLEDEPSVSGTMYTITSSYWPVSVHLKDDEDFLDVSVKADYYPNGGFVRLTLNDDHIWAVLNLRQRSILDRYVRMANAGEISKSPSTMDVLARADIDEVVGLDMGETHLPDPTAQRLFSSLSRANASPMLDPRQPPPSDGDGAWLIVTLVEGRTLRYYYDGSTLTEGLGTERYDASSVTDILSAAASSDPPVLDEEKPAGSLLWWPVMFGGGIVALGIAVWLQRRNTRTV